MCDKTNAMRFRHHFLMNGSILTVCTSLNHETREVKAGWSLFNPNDDHWIRKFGNSIALNRLEKFPLKITLSEDEPILCDYISHRVLMLILIASNQKFKNVEDITIHSPSQIPDTVLQAIQFESIRILDLVGMRINLSSITSDEYCRS